MVRIRTPSFSRWSPDTARSRTRTGTAFRAEGFSYSLQLSLLSLATHLESGLYLCHVSGPVRHGKLGRGRQVSTLSLGSNAVQLAELVVATLRASSKRGSRGLSSGLQAPRDAVGLVPRI